MPRPPLPISDDIDGVIQAITKFKAGARTGRIGIDGEFGRAVSGLVTAVSGGGRRTTGIPVAANDNGPITERQEKEGF